MRTMFWIGFTGMVILAMGAGEATRHAFAHPDSWLGRTLLQAGKTTATLHGEMCLGEPASIGMEEPVVVVEMEESVAGEVVLAKHAEPAAIVIPEDEPIPAAEMPVGSEQYLLMSYQEKQPVVLELAAGQGDPVAPRTMPYCDDEPRPLPSILTSENGMEETDEMLPFPGVFVEDEILPVSAVETEQKTSEKEAGEPAEKPAATGGAPRMLQLFGRMLKKRIGQGDEARPESGSRSALQKIRAYKMRLEEPVPAIVPADTMEFRPSDRKLHDIGPGAL